MHYLSRVKLDERNRTTLKALNCPSMFHGAVESAFSGERERNLWRIDTLRGNKYLLVMSSSKPELTQLSAQFGPTQGEILTKEYDILFPRLVEGSKWHFRLTANPTIAKKEGEKRGKIYACTKIEEQKMWLKKKAASCGFELKDENFDIIQNQWIRFQKKNSNTKVTLLSVTYEGNLTVVNMDLFITSLVNGIGREKAYGMGLLTVSSM